MTTQPTCLHLPDSLPEIDESLNQFFGVNHWNWRYYEDQIHLSTTSPHFFEILKKLVKVLSTVREVRAALQIHIHDVHHSMLEPIRDFVYHLVEYEHWFDGYNLHVCLHHNEKSLNARWVV